MPVCYASDHVTSMCSSCMTSYAEDRDITVFLSSSLTFAVLRSVTLTFSGKLCV